MHLAAKEIIANSKKLKMNGNNGDKEVAFDRVEVEQQFGPFRVDAVGVKNCRQCLVEIAVTHRCSQDKVKYFRDNMLAVLEIMIDAHRSFTGIDEYSEYVISDAPRVWISNPLLNKEAPPVVATPVDQERIRALLDRRSQLEPAFLGQLRKAASRRVNQEHYGSLVLADLSRYGISHPRVLCVKSDDLPTEYECLALVMWHHRQMRKYLGRGVRFDIIYDYEQSIFWKTATLFPRVVIRAVEGVSSKHLHGEIGSRRWRRKGYSWI